MCLDNRAQCVPRNDPVHRLQNASRLVVLAGKSVTELPVDQAISASGLRNRVWAVGQELDAKAEGAVHGERDYPPIDDQAELVALAVDSAWLRHRFTRLEKEQAHVADLYRYKPSLPRGRHVNIIARRAVRADGTCRVYGYVNKEVTSAATLLDHFLSEQGIATD
jgi:hypothetical protein